MASNGFTAGLVQRKKPDVQNFDGVLRQMDKCDNSYY